MYLLCKCECIWAVFSGPRERNCYCWKSTNRRRWEVHPLLRTATIISQKIHIKQLWWSCACYLEFSGEMMMRVVSGVVRMATWRLFENSFTADNCFPRLGGCHSPPQLPMFKTCSQHSTPCGGNKHCSINKVFFRSNSTFPCQSVNESASYQLIVLAITFTFLSLWVCINIENLNQVDRPRYD